MIDYICARCGDELLDMEEDNLKVCANCGYSSLMTQQEYYNEESDNS